MNAARNRGWMLGAVIAASLAGVTFAVGVSADAPVHHTHGDARKKGALEEPAALFLGTLVQIHTGERMALDDASPTEARFDALLSDRVTGALHPLDPRLIGLLRALATRHPGTRLELVSGYRSEKLNEMLRKKGHHVASHSQHSLGNAVDFRLVLPGETDPIEPRSLEREIRALGWEGGTGVYLGKDDRFVHADVGPNRSWSG